MLSILVGGVIALLILIFLTLLFSTQDEIPNSTRLPVINTRDHPKNSALQAQHNMGATELKKTQEAHPDAELYRRKKGIMEKLFEDAFEQPQFMTFDDLRRIRFGWFRKGIFHYLICCFCYFWVLLYRVVYLIIQLIVYVVVELLFRMIFEKLIRLMIWLITMPFKVLLHLFDGF